MKKRIFFQVFLIIFLISPVIGQNDASRSHTAISDTSYKSFRLFADDNILEISLRFDLTTYFNTKPKEDYLKANITFHISNNDSINRNIRLRTRGVFRNKYCSFSPIELNFKKTDFGYSDLNRISKLKLVPECRSGSENKNYVLREYLIYKLFNVLTDTCFRVRLLEVNYIDTKKKRKPIRQYGFFIEPIEMVTARTNTIQVDSRTLSLKSIVPESMDRLAIFNYMIGNFDWSVQGQHNVKVIKTRNDTVQLGVAFPYDFDWSGLVNAAYAVPDETIGVKSVKERIFLGPCRSKEVYQKELEIFSERKKEFYNVISEFPYLNQKAKKDITSYLDEFFDQLTGKREVIDNFLNTCKTH